MFSKVFTVLSVRTSRYVCILVRMGVGKHLTALVFLWQIVTRFNFLTHANMGFYLDTWDFRLQQTP